MNNILLIDDNTYVLEALALWIGRYLPDWNILTASNGKEGTEIMDSLPLSFIMTDIQMPVMDGYGVIEHANNKFPDIPVFVLTGDSCTEVMNRLQSLRVTECIGKPFDFEKLARKIAHALRVQTGGAALVGAAGLA